MELEKKKEEAANEKVNKILWFNHDEKKRISSPFLEYFLSQQEIVDMVGQIKHGKE